MLNRVILGNIAFVAHWNGFQSVTTKYKDCWVVEVEVLNGGRRNLQRPMPVIFIPTSSKNLLKSGEKEVMTAFLEPFIRERNLLSLMVFKCVIIFHLN